MAHTYYIGLGSNLGDRESNLRRAWEMIAQHGWGSRLSSLYESEPMYVTDQPLFLNAVGMITSSLGPRELLAELHNVEAGLGRDRTREKRMGPRTADLDILLCDSLVLDEPDLIIPHPRMTERGFVLVPLLELEPGLRDPRTGSSFAGYLRGGTKGIYSYPHR